MLFGYKKCPNCDSEYDVAFPTCPACHTPDRHYDERHISPGIVWFEKWKQVALILLGTIGLSVVASLANLFLADSGFDLLITNFIAYMIALAGIAFVIGRDVINFKPHFKSGYTYLIGVVGCIALYIFSIVYGGIVNSITNLDVSTNESIADGFIINYPWLAFFVIVFLGPICEELTYRVGFFSFLYRVKPWLAYLATIIIFAFIHFDANSFKDVELLKNEFLNLPFYLFAGATFCFLYHKWGLAASLTAHLANNLLTFILVYVRSLS